MQEATVDFAGHTLVRSCLEVDRRISRHSPVVRGKTVTVCKIISALNDGHSIAEIVAKYKITERDVRACETYSKLGLNELEQGF